MYHQSPSEIEKHKKTSKKIAVRYYLTAIYYLFGARL